MHSADLSSHCRVNTGDAASSCRDQCRHRRNCGGSATLTSLISRNVMSRLARSRRRQAASVCAEHIVAAHQLAVPAAADHRRALRSVRIHVLGHKLASVKLQIVTATADEGQHITVAKGGGNKRLRQYCWQQCKRRGANSTRRPGQLMRGRDSTQRTARQMHSATAASAKDYQSCQRGSACGKESRNSPFFDLLDLWICTEHSMLPDRRRRHAVSNNGVVGADSCLLRDVTGSRITMGPA